MRFIKSLDRIQKLYKSHPFLYASRTVITEIVRKLLGVGGIISYSQTGEDRILEWLLDISVEGTYVDVGANHPSYLSNTLLLYQRGWRGINIDGNPDLIKLHNSIRPRDKNVHAVVSDNERNVIFTIAKNSAHSTLSTTFEKLLIKERGVEKQISVTSRTLTTILRECGCPMSFDLLTVDVEGHEYEVLSSLCFEEYHPRVIVCEMHEFDLLVPEQNCVYRLLKNNGYELVAYAIWNGYFVKKEEFQQDVRT